MLSAKMDNSKGNTKPRLLLVVSNDLIRDIFKELFEKHGYYIVAVDTAKEGLKVLSVESFDIVICDYNLYDGTGLEFFESIKNICSDKKNILMITSGDLVNITEEERLNIHHVIEKPFPFEELLKIVENTPNK